MSLIERLKKLLNDEHALEELENIDDSQVEEVLGSLLDETKEEIPEFPSYLECTEEETVEYIEKLEQFKESKMRIADLMIKFDTVKNELMVQLKEREHVVIRFLNELKEKHQIPSDGYSISLPSHISEGKIIFEKSEE